MGPCEGARFGGSSLQVTWLGTSGLAARYFVELESLGRSRPGGAPGPPRAVAAGNPAQPDWASQGEGRGPGRPEGIKAG